MITSLNEPLAKALATIITVGFIKEQTDQQINSECRTMFQYEISPDEGTRIPTDYSTVALLLNKIGLDPGFTRSGSPSDFPLILAKIPGNQSELIVKQSYPLIGGLFNELDRLSDSWGGGAPVGAYIGGTLEADPESETGYRWHITGPTNMVVYAPRYVAPVPYNVYSEAFGQTDKALAIILQAKENTGTGGPGQPVEYEIDDELVKMPHNPASFMFGSIHGMVVSMLRKPYLQNDSLHFEFSMGRNTTKVSSCLPCSMFMAANGRPATSTHFGRGDYWNIPDPASANGMYPEIERQRQRWAEKIIEWYYDGRQLLRINGLMLEVTDGVLHRFKDLPADQNIPEMFLESLTFPGRFTEKIIDTLTPYLVRR